jgi:hypothetical protein
MAPPSKLSVSSFLRLMDADDNRTPPLESMITIGYFDGLYRFDSTQANIKLSLLSRNSQTPSRLDLHFLLLFHNVIFVKLSSCLRW